MSGHVKCSHVAPAAALRGIAELESGLAVAIASRSLSYEEFVPQTSKCQDTIFWIGPLHVLHQSGPKTDTMVCWCSQSEELDLCDRQT